MRAIESGSASEMVDSSSEALITEIRSKRGRWWRWPVFALVGMAGMLLVLAQEPPSWVVYLMLGGWIVLVVTTAYSDWLSKTVVVLYDFDDDIDAKYDSFLDAFSAMAKCDGMWLLEAEGEVHDKKYFGGAGRVVSRSVVTPKLKSPPNLKTNVPVPMLPAGKQQLYFLPDAVLVLENRGDVGAVSYANLALQTEAKKFVEAEQVPGDAKVVDVTWKYVNARGGPDKRFKHNRELPVALYEELRLSSPTGLQECFQISRPEVAERFADAIRVLSPAATTGG